MNVKNNAAGSAERKSAVKARSGAPLTGSPQRRSDDSSAAQCVSQSDLSEFERAFPGGRVNNGRPNRERRAMYHAWAMCRATDRGDIAVATVHFNRLHRLVIVAKTGARSTS